MDDDLAVGPTGRGPRHPAGGGSRSASTRAQKVIAVGQVDGDGRDDVRLSTTTGAALLLGTDF